RVLRVAELPDVRDDRLHARVDGQKRVPRPHLGELVERERERRREHEEPAPPIHDHFFFLPASAPLTSSGRMSKSRPITPTTSAASAMLRVGHSCEPTFHTMKSVTRP